MSQTLSATDVAGLLRISLAQVWANSNAGTLPYVRVDGDQFISPHAAAMLYERDNSWAAKQVQADIKRNRALASIETDSERKQQAIRDAQRKAERDHAHSLYVLRTEREAKLAAELEAAAGTVRRKA